MKLPEIAHMLRVARPPAPDGAWNLARCYSIEEVARRARRRLPAGARAYLEGGSEDEHTLRRNREALDRLELLPRQPRDVRGVDTSTTILGEPSPLPIVLSPVGGPRMFHHEGELAVAVIRAKRAGYRVLLVSLDTNVRSHGNGRSGPASSCPTLSRR